MSKILLLLNDPKVREEFATILKLEGHETVADKDEIFNISIIKTENPDLAVIDTAKGDALIKNVIRQFPRLPVICWMFERNAHAAIELLHEGAIDCLNVPLRAAEVIGVVNHILGRPQTSKSGTKFILPYFTIWQYRKFFRIFLSFIFVMFLFKAVLGKKNISVFDIPHKNPTSVSLSADNIWVADWYTQSIYEYKLDKKLKLIDNYYFSNFGPLAIALDNKFLWSCGNDLVLRKHVIDEKLEVVNSYKLNEHSPSGLAVIGDYLWISDSSERKIFKYIIAQELTPIYSYDCSFAVPVGLSWDGSFIWIADAKENRVYVYAENLKALDLKRIYSLPEISGCQLASICPKGKWLYAVYAGDRGKLYKYKISSLKKKEIKQ
ncbi:MAG: hypothetical protein LHV68_08270 [Elusimicrobia bacterium]|nr:hypothetical protein [Candidatus Liberimonas magnetica]